MEIRDAHSADAEAIAQIYNDAVINTTAIWNDSVIDAANRRAWIEDRKRQGYPILVAVDGVAGIVGYASFGDWRAWDGYRHTVEHSVYVRADCRGKGIGKALMVDLIACARGMGKHVMIAGIEARNIGSIRLHEHLGFQSAGLLRQVGAKFGVWLDLVFMQLILDDREEPVAGPMGIDRK